MIAKNEGVGISTVQRIKKKFEDYGVERRTIWDVQKDIRNSNTNILEYGLKKSLYCMKNLFHFDERTRYIGGIVKHFLYLHYRNLSTTV